MAGWEGTEAGDQVRDRLSRTESWWKGMGSEQGSMGWGCDGKPALYFRGWRSQDSLGAVPALEGLFGV